MSGRSCSAAARIRTLAEAGAEGGPSLFRASFFGVSGPTFEAPAVVAGFEEMAVVRQTVENSCGHFGITKHIRPFTEAQVGGDSVMQQLFGCQIPGPVSGRYARNCHQGVSRSTREVAWD